MNIMNNLIQLNQMFSNPNVDNFLYNKFSTIITAINTFHLIELNDVERMTLNHFNELYKGNDENLIGIVIIQKDIVNIWSISDFNCIINLLSDIDIAGNCIYNYLCDNISKYDTLGTIIHVDNLSHHISSVMKKFSENVYNSIDERLYWSGLIPFCDKVRYRLRTIETEKPTIYNLDDMIL